MFIENYDDDDEKVKNSISSGAATEESAGNEIDEWKERTLLRLLNLQPLQFLDRFQMSSHFAVQ